MQKRRNTRINTIMSNVGAEDLSQSRHVNLPKGTGIEQEKKEIHEYALRKSTPKTYCDENDIHTDEDFSPDVSEYFPSPERQVSLRRLSISSSSFGGDPEYIATAVENISRTPSTISNISLFFNQTDFIATPSVIYESRKFNETPDVQDDGIFRSLITPPSSGLHNKNNNKGNSRKRLEYTTHSEKNDDTDAPSTSSYTILVQEDEKQQKSTPLNIFSPNKDIESCDLNVTLIPNNISDCLPIDTTLIVDRYVTTNSEEGTPSHLSQLASELVENNDVTAQSHNKSPHLQTHHHINDSAIDEHLLHTATTVSALDKENEAPNSLPIPKPLTRKRSRNDSERLDQKSKRLKNSGEAYIGCRSKKQFDKKALKDTCKCKKRCGEKFTQEQREAIMLEYYKLGDHERQWQYISKHTVTEDIKRITLKRKCNRTQTVKYYFNLNTEEVQVCKTFFINTLSISHQIVYTALEKNQKNEGLRDMRGHHDNRPRKMNIETEKTITEHITLFPTVESHYVRKDTARKYLSELLNISKMYRLYQSWYKEKSFDCPMATKRQYETIFNTKFNYSFFKPKKDQCATCTHYRQADPCLQETLQDKYDTHQRNKERVREIKKKEKESVSTSDTTIAIFDLEKVLSIPQSQVGIFHYKRKYPVYNFTVFDACRQEGYCYVWHYQIAKRGAIEIGSCLWQFLLNEKERGTNNISFYSDGCGGQNKNRFIFAFYIFAAEKLQMNITHRFFETGHGQSEGDSMHSTIERELKNRVVYTPDQMYAIIMNAKVSGEKYKVKEMLQSEFYDIKELINNRNWVKDESGKKISWSKIMEVNVMFSQPSILRYKYNFDADYSNINTQLQANQGRTPRRKRGSMPTATTTSNSNTGRDCQLKAAYTSLLPLPKALYLDLMGLCKSEAIPRFYHGFYESLTFSESGADNEDELVDDE